MKLATAFLFALPLVSALPELKRRGEPAKSDCKKCCLSEKDINEILDQYGQIFTGSFKDEAKVTKIINDIIADDFKEYDESTNQGASEIVSNNKEEFLKNKIAYVNMQPALKDLKIDVIKQINTCDSAAHRFKASGQSQGSLEVAPGIIIPTNTTAVPAGTPVEYKGVTLYTFDCEKRKIKEVYSSADTFNFLNKIAFNLCG